MRYFRLGAMAAAGVGAIACASANLITFDNGTHSAASGNGVGSDYLASDGVTFSGNGIYLVANFNEPSLSDVMQATAGTTTIFMDCSDGITGLFSTSFACDFGAGSIQLFSGLDGSGTQLDNGTMTTGVTTAFFGSTSTWSSVSFDLGSSVAHSVAFKVNSSSFAGFTVYDNVRFSRVVAPEPFTMSLGLAGLGLFVRRKMKRA